MIAVRAVASDELTPDEVQQLRDLFAAAWAEKGGTFTEQDWEHSFGGVHFLAVDHGRILSHASVVPRHLTTDGHDLHTGYVEAVATRPKHQRNGHASTVMREASTFVDDAYDLGALDTGIPGFYERFGWQLWRGPTSVLPADGPAVPTPEEDGAVMVRLTPRTPQLDMDAGISCDRRPGDVW